MGRLRWRTVGLLLVVPAAMGLAGCSSETGPTEDVTTSTGSSTSSTAATTPLEPSPTDTPTGTAAATPSVDESDTVRTTVELPPGLSGEAQAAGEAFGAFQTFVGVSFASPPMDLGDSRAVIAGATLRDAVSTATQERAADGLSTRGTQAVTITSVVVAADGATVCAAVRDDTYEISTSGGSTRPATGEIRTYRASMTTDGTTWRTAATTVVDRC